MYKETKIVKDSANESDSSKHNETKSKPGAESIPKNNQKKGFLNILRKKVLTPIRLGKMLNGKSIYLTSFTSRIYD